MLARKLLTAVISAFFSLLITAGPVATTRGSEAVPRSQLRGRVLDPDRAVIASAKISALRKGVLASSAETNANGAFSLTLEPGEYMLQISAEGFGEFFLGVKSIPTSFEPVEILMHLAGYNAIVTVTDIAGLDTYAVSSATKTLTPL